MYIQYTNKYLYTLVGESQELVSFVKHRNPSWWHSYICISAWWQGILKCHTTVCLPVILQVSCDIIEDEVPRVARNVVLIKITRV